MSIDIQVRLKALEEMVEVLRVRIEASEIAISAAITDGTRIVRETAGILSDKIERLEKASIPRKTQSHRGDSDGPDRPGAVDIDG